MTTNFKIGSLYRFMPNDLHPRSMYTFRTVGVLKKGRRGFYSSMGNNQPVKPGEGLLMVGEMQQTVDDTPEPYEPNDGKPSHVFLVGTTLIVVEHWYCVGNIVPVYDDDGDACNDM